MDLVFCWLKMEMASKKRGKAPCCCGCPCCCWLPENERDDDEAGRFGEEVKIEETGGIIGKGKNWLWLESVEEEAAAA